AAAWRDVQAALERRAPHLPVTLYPTLVQGDAAGGRIAAAIRSAGRDAAKAGHDVLLLVRGGGSLEDLWAFNEEAVARAIRACPIPVVSGVGHETDVTIADFAADLRAATPTAAAELASAGFFEVRQALAGLHLALGRAMERRLATLAQRLDRAAARLIHPRERIARARLTLDSLARRLHAAPRRQLDIRQARLASLGLHLRMRRPDIVERSKRLDALSMRLGRARDHWLDSRHNRLAALAAGLIVEIAVAGPLPGPVVDTQWLASNLDKVQVVDVRSRVKSFVTEPEFETTASTEITAAPSSAREETLALKTLNMRASSNCYFND
ncbi:MAG: exodeoxyribonuclease VII large subunit, partial [Zoogloea sp.]|nr:exodeoxyribonuclease VII large subunit [Zoogloea sp.]